MDKNELKMDVEFKMNSYNEEINQCITAIEQLNNKRAQLLLEIAKHQGMLEMLDKLDTLE